MRYAASSQTTIGVWEVTYDDGSGRTATGPHWLAESASEAVDLWREWSHGAYGDPIAVRLVERVERARALSQARDLERYNEQEDFWARWRRGDVQ